MSADHTTSADRAGSQDQTAFADRSELAGAHLAAPRPLRPVRGWFRLLGSELRLILSKRRNQFGLAILAVVPIIMAIAIKTTGDGNLEFGSVTNGVLIPMAALGIEAVFFLPLAVSMLAGDSIAGEAHAGTLRYLLLTPVGRVRLLAVKFTSLALGAAIGVFLIAATGLLLGTILFGVGPTVTLSGTSISYLAGVWRLVLAGLYLTVLMTAVASVGLLLSTFTDQPLGVTVATMVVVILSLITQGISQLAWLQPYLIPHWVTAVIGVMRDPIFGTEMVKGIGVAAGWIAVCLTAAWARFTTKDIAS